MVLKIEMLDDEGKAMHAMIALYWKAEGYVHIYDQTNVY